MRQQLITDSLNQKLIDQGLQRKLPESYPLIKMYREFLQITHPDQPEAVKSYIGVVRRCLYYVYIYFKKQFGSVPTHWSELLQYPEAIFKYFTLYVLYSHSDKT